MTAATTKTITNTFNGNIGRMFARQTAPSAYGAHATAAAVSANELVDPVDRVTFSPFAPKPLNADFLREAMATGRVLAEGGEPAAESSAKLREDRVFAAVSALALLGHTGDEQPVRWPGGFAAPTRQELEAARRRLAQRPQHQDNADDAESVRVERLELMRKIGGRDLSLASVVAGAAPQPAMTA